MENTQNTTVTYKNATPKEQAARRAAQLERDKEFLASRGLNNEGTKDFGRLDAAKVIKTLTSKTGKPGKEYLFALHEPKNPNANNQGTVFFRFHTFAPKMIKLFDKIVDIKHRAMAKKDHKLTARILSGKDAKGYRDVAWIDLFYDRKQVKISL